MNRHFSLGTVTADQLIALNDELAALARAGVPLDRGLLHLGRDLPGRLGKLALVLGQRLERGEEPARVLDDPELPPAYRALVAAGVRSGRLALALECLSELLRRVAETRQLVLGALIYPLFVLGLAYTVFLFTLLKILPVLAHVSSSSQSPPRPELRLPHLWLAEHPGWWAPWLPLLALVLFGAWWLRTRRVLSGTGAGEPRGFERQRPTVRNLLHAGRMATFADVLAVLIEQQVPLPEALTLAADASGDRRLQASSRQFAERLQRGEVPAGGLALAGAPPLLAWLLSNPASELRWQEALRRAAESYRCRARWMARWLAVYMPLWLTIAIGGTAVLVYGLAVFGPWCRFLYVLSLP